MGVSKSIKICIYILAILLILSPIVVFDYFNNEKIEKEIKTSINNIKALEQEGQNYRLVTSADNVQVPVPKGYVASEATGENYVTPEYSHTTTTHKVSTTPSILTWSSPAGEVYPWTQDENGIWISGNKGIPDSESVLESEEFDYIKGTTLTINYTYSSRSGDYLNIYLINLTKNTILNIVENIYGNTSTLFDYTTSNYTDTMNDLETGRYKIRATYSKNFLNDEGQDSGYIKTSTYFKEDENGTEIIEEEIKTKIHDGGFVIYQLTDAELETDPNGTNVIINDTNKETAQITRNQYVWVPVSNIEDIVRTKTINNGIMQFGQGYLFSNTSITKETRTKKEYYKEPRLVAEYDKTKYYLQKFSNINKREDYLNEQQEEFKNMISSVQKYGGYYIGRYETGDDYEHNYTKGYYITPRVVRYNININWVTWYDSYKDLQRLSGKTEKYVETGMIYDTMYDYTLKWLNETNTRSYEEINVDSGAWGNYKNYSFKYKESSNGIEKIKRENSQKITPTGGITEIIYNRIIYNDSPTASNNIFDIAGSVEEWSRSQSSVYSRSLRGGNFNYNCSSYPASSFYYGYQNSSAEHHGSRGILLIR